MFKRLRNLWDLSEYKPKDLEEGATIEKTMPHRKQPAKIVNMEEAVDMFPEHQENP